MTNHLSLPCWYVVHTQPQKEDLAVMHLRNQSYDVFLPKCHQVRHHARKKTVVLRPLFPRYLFISLNLVVQPWLSIESSRGVSYLLRRRNGEPIPMPEGVVERMKEAQSAQQEVVPLSSLALFRQGERLEIVEGSFVGNTAIYEKMTEGERVQLLLNILGREVRIALSVHQVMSL